MDAEEPQHKRQQTVSISHKLVSSAKPLKLADGTMYSADELPRLMRTIMAAWCICIKCENQCDQRNNSRCFG